MITWVGDMGTTGRAKTRLRQAYVAAQSQGLIRYESRAAPKRSGGGTRRARYAEFRLETITPGFEPLRTLKSRLESRPLLVSGNPGTLVLDWPPTIAPLRPV